MVTLNILNILKIFYIIILLYYNLSYLMQKYLISSCDTNNIDVIVVISKSDIIFDVNEKIINKFNISTNIITFISELEEKLMSICHR